jgi:hypothetical protein
MSGRTVGSAHPLEKSAPGFEAQAYTASILAGPLFGYMACSGLEDELRNGGRNDPETFML